MATASGSRFMRISKRCLMLNSSVLNVNILNSNVFRLLEQRGSQVIGCSFSSILTTTNTKQVEKNGEEGNVSNLQKEDHDFQSQPLLRNQLKGFKPLMDYRYIFPEFLPDPDMSRRHHISERLERTDMLNRRRVLEIPEFYVGSVLAVTASDKYAPGKINRFVGICIIRAEQGLRTNFLLRNHLENQGVEILYDLYNPSILKIEVLRLEKRLDEQLLYLRDADPEHSTFSFNMEPEHHPENTAVPVNPVKVQLRGLPWTARWELWNLKGVKPLEVPQEKWDIKEKNDRPWKVWDLMAEYRRTIHEEDQLEIWKDVDIHHREMKQMRKTDRRKLLLKKALEKK